MGLDRFFRRENPNRAAINALVEERRRLQDELESLHGMLIAGVSNVSNDAVRAVMNEGNRRGAEVRRDELEARIDAISTQINNLR